VNVYPFIEAEKQRSTTHQAGGGNVARACELLKSWSMSDRAAVGRLSELVLPPGFSMVEEEVNHPPGSDQPGYGASSSAPTPTTRAAAPALKVRNGLVKLAWLGEAGTARLGSRGPVGGCRTRCLRPRSTVGIAGPPRRRTRRIRSVSATGRDGHSRWWRRVALCARYGGSSTRGSRGSRLLPAGVTGGAGDGAHRGVLVSGSRCASGARLSWLVLLGLPLRGLLHPFAESRRSLEGAGGLNRHGAAGDGRLIGYSVELLELVSW